MDFPAFSATAQTSEFPSRRRARISFVATVVVALVVGWGGSFLYYRHQHAQDTDAIIQQVINKDQGKSAAVDFSLFWQVWDRLHDKFVDHDKLDSQKLVYGAISGMVRAAGDPYTVFFEPVVSKQFQEEVSGEFSGVGMEIGMRNNVITVIAPIKNSPALKAGIKSGDVVVKIGSTGTDGLSVEEAVALIRGKKGTSVTLKIAREGEGALLDFTLVRDTIKVPAVDWKLVDGHVAYVQIYSFNANAESEFAKAAQEIANNGKVDRLILDLRDNPGGLLDSAVSMAGWLLETNKLVVQERFSNGLSQDLRSSGNARLAKLPTAVLINGGSASASEILAGALHDTRDLALVGEKSFGKGSVQQVDDFYNGSSLKVTIAKWFTPNGVSISDTGITPTVEIKIDPKEYVAKDRQIGEPGKDPQLDKALEILK